MNKVFGLLVFLICCFCFTGCPGSVEDYLLTEKKVDLSEYNLTGKTYLVQTNMGHSTYSKNLLTYIKDVEYEGSNINPNVFSSSILKPNINNNYQLTKPQKAIIGEYNAMKRSEDAFKQIKLIESSSREANNIPDNPTYNVGDKKNFYIFKDGTEQLFEGELIVQNEKCNVWFVDNCNFDINTVREKYRNNNLKILKKDTDKTLFDNTFNNILTKFSDIYDVETELFGNQVPKKSYQEIIKISDKDKINIIVADIYSNPLEENESTTYGYFYSIDYFRKDLKDSYYTNNPSIVQNIMKSNEMPCIYIDSFNLINNENSSYSTLAHEFNHLLLFANKSLKLNTTPSTWYTEMLAMECEDILQNVIFGNTDNYSLGERINYFLPNINYGFYIWQQGDNVLKSYASSFIFGNYLTKNYGLENLLKEIFSNDYTDELSITKALQKVTNSNITFNTVLKDEYQILLNPLKKDKNNFSLYLTPEDGNYSFNVANKECIIYSHDLRKVMYNDYQLLNLITSVSATNVDYFEDLYPYGLAVNLIGENDIKTFTICNYIPNSSTYSYKIINVSPEGILTEIDIN